MDFGNGDETPVAKKPKLDGDQAKQAETEIDVNKFGGDSGLADVVLVVEDVRIPVIKVVLSLVSPVFRAMFESDFKEKNLKEIPLPGKKLGPFLHFLSWIYPDKREPLTARFACPVAQLASEYQVMKLKEESDEVICRHLKKLLPSCKQLNGYGLHIETTIDLFKYLQYTEPLGLIKTTNFCVQMLSEVKLQTQKDAFQAFKISEESKRQITDLAREKLDMFERDTVYLMSILGPNLPKDAIRRQSHSFFPNERLRTVRLAYFHCGHSSDVYADSLKKIKEDFKEKEKYLSDESFLIMPERLKDDIETVLSYTLNGRV